MLGYLIGLVQLVVNLLSILLIAYAVMSFLPLEPWHPARRFIERLAEPLVRPFRQLLPPVGMFDFSVMVALIVIQLVGQILIGLLVRVF